MSTSFTTTGTISHIFEERQVSEKFRLQEFAISVPDGNYPQTIKFQVTNDRIDLLSPYAVGQEIEVSFNLRGREFTKNGQVSVFNSLDAWKIQTPGQGQQPAQSANKNPNLRAQPAAAPAANDEDNDLPF
ncbi:DUF3127 domain-containing protein [Hymenobacter metallicola]|uniref:DUF3127 domain-containing protein n=1 Tax=Hymenobacter metallicola TaxID=2563114 RepID=A0A4Z0QKJ7_9BACT|nr:DUF3127 domain-containing protein [Hymenobacter metallicola]TGE29773.1 DUF3127 domain-containing protein [Hymenobacter metallicola]